MNSNGIRKFLKKYGANENFYEITNKTNISINNKVYGCSSNFSIPDIFVKHYINNINQINKIYIYNIVNFRNDIYDFRIIITDEKCLHKNRKYKLEKIIENIK